MPFTLNLSGSAQVDDSIVKEFDAEFRTQLTELGHAAQFTSVKRGIKGESVSMPRYNQLVLDTTPLDELEDVASEALVDDKIILTPLEYGKAVTTTKLASLVTAGMADKAAARMVGVNAGRTDNKLALLALDASSNVLIAGGGVDADAITQTDIMGDSLMNKAYNKLSRANAVGVANGEFVMICHEDVIFDLRDGAGAGTWQDAHKYTSPETVLRNEVGMYRGFRVIRDNLSTVAANVGGIDVYKSHFIGFNALGKAESQAIEMRATGPFDKLNRFVNLGWHGVFQYGIVEQDALWTIDSASSSQQ